MAKKDSNKDINTVFMIATIKGLNENYVMSGGIKRILIDIRNYDGDGKIVTNKLILSELTEQRKSTGLSRGDVILFRGGVLSLPGDDIAFYTEDIYVLRKNTYVNEELSDKYVDATLSSFKYDRNLVFLAGEVCVSQNNNVCLAIQNTNTIRGDSEDKYHIWIKATNSKIPEIGNYVSFIGNAGRGVLKGQLFITE